MTDLQSRIAALPEWPELEPLPTRELPYTQTNATCLICSSPVSGDFGMVPDVCEACVTHGLMRYERRYADAALARLALLREWVAKNPHTEDCDMQTPVYEVPRCTCGRDALLKATEVGT